MLTIRRYGNPSARAVFVLHGGPGAWGQTAPVARRLGRRFQVIEPFQRASGGAPLSVATHVQDLHELIVAGAAAKPVLLGWSWGAMLALAYAAAHPETTGPIVLVGCGTFDRTARARMHEIIEQRLTDGVRTRVAEARNLEDPTEALRAEEDAMTPVYVYDPLSEVSCELEGGDARAGEETWDDMIRLQDSGVYPAAFSRITAPVLMLHGTFDPHPGELIRDSLRRFLPQLEYRRLETCGHYPWRERAASEPFYAAIVEWLSQPCPPRAKVIVAPTMRRPRRGQESSPFSL